MNSFCLVVFVALWGSLSAFFIFHKETSNPTLKLVHVLFRHGNRNPDAGSLIAGSPYSNESYYPEGLGQLTNTGKQREYTIGSQLRNKYDDFLTKTWDIDFLDVRTTNVDRTKMSVELMLSSLYPPRGTQIWSVLFWQPIPYNYFPNPEDKETQPWAACSTVQGERYQSVLNSPEIVEYAKRYKDLFYILGNHIGENASFADAFSYYFGFQTMKEVGYPLEDWTSLIYPEPIHSAVVDYYYLLTNTTLLRRTMAGYLLRKILSDTKEKINGTLTPTDRKMFIYSGHELNVASMILSLEAFKITDVPAYGAYVLFEVHEIDGVWGIKLFYQYYQSDDPIAVKIPECDYFCPYDKFYNLVEKILPTDDTDCFAS